MKNLCVICLLVLISGCATGGFSSDCAGANRCADAKQQIMRDALHNRPY